jgi:hypothetical protein
MPFGFVWIQEWRKKINNIYFYKLLMVASFYIFHGEGGKTNHSCFASRSARIKFVFFFLRSVAN